MCRITILAYTRHLEFISVYHIENYQSWGSSADLSHAKVDKKKVKKITHFQKISRKWQGEHISSYSWPILDFGQREGGALLILAYIKQIECILWQNYWYWGSSADAHNKQQGWQKQVGWMNYGRIEGALFLLLAYTRQPEFISVYFLVRYQSWVSSADAQLKQQGWRKRVGRMNLGRIEVALVLVLAYTLPV